jgi:putative Holliday junction resolvase
VGVAVADVLTAAVRPLATFQRANPDSDARVVARLAEEQSAGELVIGLPLDMDGREGEQARLTRAWADQIAARTGLPVSWRDERLTTAAAEAGRRRLRRLPDGTPTRSAIMARRTAVDREAAARILQAELDARAAIAGAPGVPHPGSTRVPESSGREERGV